MKKIIRTSTIPLSLNVFCRGLLVELSKDYEVIAVSSPGKDLDCIKEREDVKTYGVEMKRKISPFSDLRAVWHLIKIFRKEKPDLIHSITPKAGLLTLLAGKISGVPVRIHTFTGLLFPTSHGLKRKLFKICDKLTCKFATHIIAEGNDVRNDLINAKVTKKNIRILGNGSLNGINTEYFKTSGDILQEAREVREHLNANEKTIIFLYVGRLARDKGIGELATAFVRLRRENPDMRLLLVGKSDEDDPIDNDIEKIIFDSKDIYFSDTWENDIRKYYAASDVFVLPSYREGFPNSLLEAASMKLPSIVTDINGSREIVVHGETGVIVPPKDEDALYLAMREFSIKSSEMNDMGDKARERVKSRYEQRFVRDKLKEFYHEVLA